MTKKSIAPVVAAVLLALLAVPRSSQGSRRLYKESFLPPNSLRIPVGDVRARGITQQQYNAVMDRVQELYAPIIAARGGTLVVNRLWDDPTVNASAERDGNNYIINMYGGLARHETITQDGMALVACHELGHHLGGAPKYGGFEWASNEGQADYYANLKCLHRVFASPGAKSFTRSAADDVVAKAACAKSYPKSAAEAALCLRSANAGMSVTALFRALRREDPVPHFDTPDPAVVQEMFDGHPGTQCRLDTYFQGSLCSRPYTDPLDETDPAVGTCTRSQGFAVGLRPQCWYKPPANEPAGQPKSLAGATLKEPAVLEALKSPALWQGL